MKNGHQLLSYKWYKLKRKDAWKLINGNLIPTINFIHFGEKKCKCKYTNTKLCSRLVSVWTRTYSYWKKWVSIDVDHDGIMSFSVRLTLVERINYIYTLFIVVPPFSSVPVSLTNCRIYRTYDSNSACKSKFIVCGGHLMHFYPRPGQTIYRGVSGKRLWKGSIVFFFNTVK